MAFESVICPNCQTENPSYMVKCTNCGVDISSRALPAALRSDPIRWRIVLSAIGTALLSLAAVFLLVLGFFVAVDPDYKTAHYVGAAACGILARVCRASAHRR
jgi:hypothetical protein